MRDDTQSGLTPTTMLWDPPLEDGPGLTTHTPMLIFIVLGGGGVWEQGSTQGSSTQQQSLVSGEALQCITTTTDHHCMLPYDKPHRISR
eukprot:3484583-Rhodomonas_salina.1